MKNFEGNKKSKVKVAAFVSNHTKTKDEAFVEELALVQIVN